MQVRTIVDLGGGNGSYMASQLHRLPNTQVTIADIDGRALDEARTRFGFRTIRIEEDGPLPFGDGEFDLIFCNSTIEHVTISKELVWAVADGATFRETALRHQSMFAAEIRRASRMYFVQTPNRTFPIESHTWLPLVQFLPRPALIRLLQMTSRMWITRTRPDWNLLGRREMQVLFPDAKIVVETAMGLPKSIIACRI